MTLADKLIFHLYTLAIRAGDLYISIGSLFSDKLKKMRHGRDQSMDRLPSWNLNAGAGPVIWMHCSSLGEFEQGRPLIEDLKKKVKGLRVVLSFFSPSGYEIRKDYPMADFIFYLPSDLPRACRQMAECIKPDAFILVKYDLWWNIISVLQEKNVPVFLISGLFRGNEYYFKAISRTFSHCLRQFAGIFVQDKNSLAVLAEKGFKNVYLAGDTRIDRVKERAATAVIPEKLTAMASGKKVIVYGSIWPADLRVINTLVQMPGNYLHIIAPHDISPSSINTISDKLRATPCLWSEHKWTSDVIIVDNIGLLSSLYKTAFCAYIGGGFGKSIHNILEPAAYGIPVLFGPRHHRFVEASELIRLGGGFEIKKEKEAEDLIRAFESDPDLYQKACRASHSYISRNSGATKIISEKISALIRPGLILRP